MKLLKAPLRNQGDGKPIEKERLLNSIRFKKYKFNNRPCPTNKNILFITCFFEFGCETIGVEYCISKILQDYENYYVIGIGWHGRKYLYQHLLDEFWELDEEFQWLREYTSAFLHESKNIRKLEFDLSKFGKVYRGELMGNYCLHARCEMCKSIWTSEKKVACCPQCFSLSIQNSPLSDPENNKKGRIKVPMPSQEKLNWAEKLIKPNSVGIFARNRIKYGRNLPSSFYVSLIDRLKKLNLNPVWLGEKQSILPCPVDNILDFSSMPESDDLENTLAVVSKLQLTLQFWTASTRLSALVDTPFILFESDCQIYGMGHEGRRIALTTDYDKKKLVLCQYAQALANQTKILDMVEKSISEVKQGNWEDICDMIEHLDLLELRKNKKNIWGS